MRKRHGVLPALVGALALAWTLSTAEAVKALSCVDFTTALEEAPVVFLGAVTDISFSDENRMATFRVEEVWKGDVDPVVIVDGGRPPQKVRRATVAGEPTVLTGGHAWYTGRTFRLGGRYLVVPREEDGVLRDDRCSATRSYTKDLDRLRPPNVRTVTWEASQSLRDEVRLAGATGAPIWASDWIVPSFLLAVGGGLGLAWRLRRRARRVP